ncbi:fimbrial protein [Serratia inhibens]|uniref:Fimbrial protein n=1 Tax=Serratia inhibens TaxID=2338073 RepID=A0AA92X5S5_9GAMM|nr:fimbrial protein [Serratia inhibens]RJF53920.1 fimbrial protein [Serratia inhibens]
MRVMKRVVVGGMCLSAVMLLSAVKAVADTAIVTIKVTVIVPPPCIINGDRVIDVDFGSDVVTSRVDGTNYLKTVDYTLVCQGNTSNAMKLQIQGIPTAFDSSALQTNMADLGIALKANGSALTVNDWVNFTYPNKPLLQAVPVKKAGVTLTGGDFSAGATLLVHYQ